MPPTASIIIRCFNEEKHIRRLLTGIEHQSVESKVILVDSGSTDRTIQIAESFPVKLVHIEPDQFSFGRALNRGGAEASGDVLVFISAHCYPTYDDWLAHLLEPFDDPAVVLAYGKQRGNHVTKFSEHQVFAQWFPDVPDPDQKHPFCNNANCAVRRTAWLDRAYDEEITGLEDIEWATWALEVGHRLVYAPAAEIVHVHEESPGRIYNRYRREAIAFRQIFPHEGFGFRDFARLLWGSIRSDLRKAREQGRWGRALEIVMFRLMQYGGTLGGFEQHGPVTSELKRKLYFPHTPDGVEAGSRRSPRRQIPYVDGEGMER